MNIRKSIRWVPILIVVLLLGQLAFGALVSSAWCGEGFDCNSFGHVVRRHEVREFTHFGFNTFGRPFNRFGFTTFGFTTFGRPFNDFGFNTFGFNTFGFNTFGFNTFGGVMR